MTHLLKVWDEYIFDIATGRKPFEVRRNDRNFQKGDSLTLEGYDPIKQAYTDKRVEVDVTYILEGGRFGIETGYVVMGIKVKNYNF